MSKKNIIITVCAVLLIGIIGGYWFGSKPSSGVVSDAVGRNPVADMPADDYTPAGQPINYNELLSDYQRKIAADPNDWETNASMGDIYFGMRQFDNAVVYYKKTLELNPNDVDTYNDLGLAIHYLGRSPEGLEYIEKGIKKNPYYQRIYLTKGFILAYGLGKTKDAEAAWKKVVSIDPNSPMGRDAGAFIEEFKKK